jgi:hypothetical protein
VIMKVRTSLRPRNRETTHFRVTGGLDHSNSTQTVKADRFRLAGLAKSASGSSGIRHNSRQAIESATSAQRVSDLACSAEEHHPHVRLGRSLDWSLKSPSCGGGGLYVCAMSLTCCVGHDRVAQ